MLSYKISFFITILCGILSISLAQPECKKCMANLAYCIDATHYYFCPDGKNPSTNSGPIECESGKHCTESGSICGAEIQNHPCGSSGTCNECSSDTSKPFTCVSRTEYGFCRNGAVAQTLSCDEDQVCSVDMYNENQKICAPASVLEYLGHSITCDTEGGVTQTPTTPDYEDLRSLCIAAEREGNTNRYFYILNTNDNSCRSYIYCERMGNNMEAVHFSCQPGFFYDSVTRKCVQPKPASCSQITTTPSTGTTTAGTQGTTDSTDEATDGTTVTEGGAGF